MERHCSGDPNRSQKSRVSSTDLIGYPRCPTKNKNNYVIPIFVHRKRVFFTFAKSTRNFDKMLLKEDFNEVVVNLRQIKVTVLKDYNI